ncbi:Chorein N-terminal domain-containing protein [Entamoeba marina]
MFEKLVVEVLTRYFGKYISGLNSDNLKVSLWAGDVSLNNLEINSNAFDSLFVGIPLKVLSGTVDSQSVVVKISDIDITVTTDYTVDVSIIAEQLKNEEQASKQRRLREFEMTSNTNTLTQRILTKVVNNMQVEIKNIHLRYQKLNETDSQIHSLVEELTTKLQLTLSDKTEDFPIAGKIFLELLKVGITQSVMIDIKSLLQQQKLFEGKCSQIERHVSRPSQTVADDPKSWWTYAAKSILVEVNKRKYKESNEYKLKRRVLRQEYTDIYSRVLNDKEVEGDKQRFNELEMELSVNEMIQLRNFAKTEIDEAKKSNSSVWNWMGYSTQINTQLSEDIHAFLDNLNDPFIEIEVDNVQCGIIKKTIGFTSQIDIKDTYVKGSNGSKYPFIFSSTDNSNNLLNINITTEQDDTIERDIAISLQLSPTQIVYNKKMAEEIMKLYQSLDIVESFGRIGMNLHMMNLERLLDEHVRAIISTTIHTPKFIIESDDKEVQLDFGTIVIDTNDRSGIYDSYNVVIKILIVV